MTVAHDDPPPDPDGDAGSAPGPHPGPRPSRLPTTSVRAVASRPHRIFTVSQPAALEVLCACGWETSVPAPPGQGRHHAWDAAGFLASRHLGVMPDPEPQPGIRWRRMVESARLLARAWARRERPRSSPEEVAGLIVSQVGGDVSVLGIAYAETLAAYRATKDPTDRTACLLLCHAHLDSLATA